MEEANFLVIEHHLKLLHANFRGAFQWSLQI